MRLGTLGWMLVVAGVVMAGCATQDTETLPDAGPGPDAGLDAGFDAGFDAGPDAGLDAGPDAGDGRCTRDSDCASGQQCELATGECRLRDIQRCLTSTNCLSSELCHPTAGVCVQTCASSADCPDSAKTCAEVSATDSRKICQCSTDALCNVGRDTAGLVCSNRGSVCAPKCTADADCGEGRCNTETGQCQEDSTGLSCTGEGQSSCDYGTHFCDAGRCARLPAPGCINHTNFPNKEHLGTTGPILYGARWVSTTTDTTYCFSAAPKRVKVAVSAYSNANRPFPPLKGELAGFFYVTAEGTPTNATNLVFPSSDYTVSGANREHAEIIVSLCFPQTTRSASLGFYFTQGNFLCHQASF